MNMFTKRFENMEKVQIFVNNPNISKLHSERNQQQQNAFGECLLPFGTESSAMQDATQKCED